MTDTVDEAELVELKRLLAEATKGVWSWEPNPATVYAGRKGDFGNFPGTNFPIRHHGFNLFGRLHDLSWNGENDLNLAVAAVNALPRLLQSLAEQSAKLAEVERENAFLQEQVRRFEAMAFGGHFLGGLLD